MEGAGDEEEREGVALRAESGEDGAEWEATLGGVVVSMTVWMCCAFWKGGGKEGLERKGGARRLRKFFWCFLTGKPW